jgi:hypothetical protein
MSYYLLSSTYYLVTLCSFLLLHNNVKLEFCWYPKTSLMIDSILPAPVQQNNHVLVVNTVCVLNTAKTLILLANLEASRHTYGVFFFVYVQRLSCENE